MYEIQKTFEVAGAHRLTLDYDSQCQNLHGHSWIITVYCRCLDLNKNGMVIDFTEIKKLVHDKMDHKCLNDVFDFNPTAENIAEWITSVVPHCYKASVQESIGNIASYTVEDLV